MTKSKKERPDKIRNQAKVAWELLKDPLATTREIAKRAWVSRQSVSTHAKQVWHSLTKSDLIEEIIKKDITIVSLAQDEIMRRLAVPDKEKTRDIISAADTSAKRYSLFKGDATDENGGMRDLSSMTLDELKQIAFNLKE